MKTLSFGFRIVAVVVGLLVAPGTLGAAPLPVTISAAYVPAITDGLSPTDPAWVQAPEVLVALDALITDMQAMQMQMPMQWRQVRARAMHDGTNIFFRFFWSDATADASVADTPSFADAFAMQIPFFTTTSIAMGNPSGPVNILFWRADLPAPENIVAGGAGTVQRSPDSNGLVAHSQTRGTNSWTVILRRPLTPATDNMVRLARGTKYLINFANWNGATSERNGIKRVASAWQYLLVR